ncbi:helix-turn-helix domain-containing protein [Nocardia sp. NPDC004860]|uniref:PucR family transcriptional regulator n=1 Tax=Nocardia sp. NPDC004860 TaxID=3154557 RepID=UPI0033B938B6
MHAAVSAEGARRVADRLVDAIGGWALLLDATGVLRASVPSGARSHLPRVRTELARFADQMSPAVIAISLPNETVSIFPIQTRGRVRGYLALGRTSTLNPSERSLVDTATLLLTAEWRKEDALILPARRHNRALLQVLLEGRRDVARNLGEILRIPTPDGDVRAALLGVPRRFRTDLLEAVEQDPALRRVETVVAEIQPGRVGVVLPVAEGDVRTLEAVLRHVPFAHGAVSERTTIDELPTAWRQVRGVFDAASDVTGRLYETKDLSDAGLLRHLRSDSAITWAHAALAPVVTLSEGSKVDFLQTLRAFLGNNGQADASATALGIHRHTLRYRMSRIEDALQQDLDDPNIRAELWVALRLASDNIPMPAAPTAVSSRQPS